MLALVLTTTGALAAGSAHAATVTDARREVHRLWGRQAPRMMCIIGRESGWNPRAVSRTNDHGLVQLHAPVWRRHFGRRWQHVYDPVANVRMGYQVWLRQGWAAWTTARRCT